MQWSLPIVWRTLHWTSSSPVTTLTLLPDYIVLRAYVTLDNAATHAFQNRCPRALVLQSPIQFIQSFPLINSWHLDEQERTRSLLAANPQHGFARETPFCAFGCFFCWWEWWGWGCAKVERDRVRYGWNALYVFLFIRPLVSLFLCRVVYGNYHGFLLQENWRKQKKEKPRDISKHLAIQHTITHS